jgi:hypothetical protein
MKIICHRSHYISGTFKSVSSMEHTLSLFILCGVFHFDYPEFSRFLFQLNIISADDLDGGLISWNWPWRKKASTGFYSSQKF